MDAVLPGDSLSLSKAAHVERVEATLLAGIQGPSFASLKQSAEHAGFINDHLGFMVNIALFHTLLVRLAIAVAALPISCLVLSRERLLDMMDPRYTNSSITSKV